MNFRLLLMGALLFSLSQVSCGSGQSVSVSTRAAAQAETGLSQIASASVENATAGVPSYLFVHEGSSGRIEKIPGKPGKYTLTVNLPENRSFVGVDQVTVFPDRPFRGSKSMPMHRFAGLWRYGHTMQTDPPNAALTADTNRIRNEKFLPSKIIVIEDAKYRVSRHTITYTISEEPGGQSIAQYVGVPLTNISLFIDSWKSFKHWVHRKVEAVAHVAASAISATESDAERLAAATERVAAATKHAATSAWNATKRYVDAHLKDIECEGAVVGLAALGEVINVAVDTALEAGGDEAAAAGEAEGVAGAVESFAGGVAKSVVIGTIAEKVADAAAKHIRDEAGPAVTDGDEETMAIAFKMVIVEALNIAMGEPGTAFTDAIEPVVLESLGCGAKTVTAPDPLPDAGAPCTWQGIAITGWYQQPDAPAGQCIAPAGRKCCNITTRGTPPVSICWAPFQDYTTPEAMNNWVAECI